MRPSLRSLALTALTGAILTEARSCKHKHRASPFDGPDVSLVSNPEADFVVEESPTEEAPSGTSTVTAPTGTHNSTTMYGPTANPKVDRADWGNYKPSRNISLYYGSSDVADEGAIEMNIAMLSDAVALEYIETITKVDCGSPDDDAMAIFFNSTEALRMAVENWTENQNLVIITDQCEEEFERGFFVVETLVPVEEELTVRLHASKRKVEELADNLELSFTSIPAATLTKRISLDPSTSLTFSEGLTPDSVLLSEPPYVTVIANEAFFTSTVTFSGYLKYNFWTFSLDQLYFDLDATFSSNLELAINLAAEYSNKFTFSPDELSYALVDVPGIVKLGPGITFALGVDLDTKGKVDVVAGLGIDLPDGNVHVDLLDDTKSTTTGWTPDYSSFANITEKAVVAVKTSASVTVELAIDVLGGLVDLSTGLTATPGFNNVFTLESSQTVNDDGTGGAVELELPDVEGVCDQGVHAKTDFMFDLTAFATQWWRESLYNTVVPILDQCYEFV